MGWLGRGWRGEEDLWKMVWVNGFLLVFLGEVACITLRLFTDIDIDSPKSGIGTLFNYIALFYCFWLLVSLWRCAFNADWGGWGYLTRLIVILYLGVFGFFCYTQHRLLSPGEVFTADSAKLLEQMAKWLFNHAVILARSIRVRA